MNEIKNPFAPGAGFPPPELAGRDKILQKADILLQRVQAGRAAKSLLMTGLRGVGKTVLLTEIEQRAIELQYLTAQMEIDEPKSLAKSLIPKIRQLLFQLDRIKGATDKVKKGLRVLVSFANSLKLKVGEIELGLDIEPEKGTADNGDLSIDLPALLTILGQAAQQKQKAIVFLIDEIQYLGSDELGPLIVAMHKIQQQKLPLALIGAGLPTLPGLAGDSKSYSERLFEYPSVGALNQEHAHLAISKPIIDAGEEITSDALEEIFQVTQGYPYFLQEWGYHIWNCAPQSPIQLKDVTQATRLSIQQLDNNFFKVRLDRLTPKEKQYLRAMAELNQGPYRSANVANLLGKKLNEVGPVRNSLIQKGMIYSPSHGELDFTVPLFESFMKRAIPKMESTFE